MCSTWGRSDLVGKNFKRKMPQGMPVKCHTLRHLSLFPAHVTPGGLLMYYPVFFAIFIDYGRVTWKQLPWSVASAQMDPLWDSVILSAMDRPSP